MTLSRPPIDPFGQPRKPTEKKMVKAKGDKLRGVVVRSSPDDRISLGLVWRKRTGKRTSA
jgi:hypothetical protein